MSVEQRRLQEHTGMASVISRILGREESEGSVILSRLHRKRPRIAAHTGGSSGSSGEEEEEAGEEEEEGEGEEVTVHKISHGDVVKSCRKVPDSSSLEVERKLQRIATQGVMSSVDKGSFIDMLKGKAETQIQKTRKQKSKPDGQQPSWSILRDDYMKGSKFKDWDRQSDCDQSDGTSDDDL